MRKASAGMLFLAGLGAVVAVAAATFVVVVLLDLDGDGSDGGGAGTPTTAAPGETSTTLRPLTPDQLAVTGVATVANVERGTIDRVETPLQITTSVDSGERGAVLFDVEVDNRITQIVWDGGRPFDLQGAGLGIVPPVVNVFAEPTAITFGFPDGTVNNLVEGSYGLATPVAVGGGGLAVPYEAVAFEATVESTIVFSGGAVTSVLPRELSMTGPGRVLLQGMLEVRRPDGTVVTAAAVELPEGPFELRLVPRGDGSGYDVDALLQGPVTVT